MEEEALIPVPAAPLERPQTLSSRNYDAKAVAAAIDATERALGGRAALVSALTHAPESDDLAYVIRLLADPSMDTRPLSAVCRAGNIHLGDLLHAFKAGRYARMFAQTTETIATHTPAVVEDVMVRAQPHLVVCPTCWGRPSTTPDLCSTCAGSGQITQLPDLDRQKLALDIAGVTPKKAPLVDARSITTNSFGDASPQGFAKLLSMTDQILHKTRPARTADASPVIDAETVDSTTPGT